jgi:cytochrome c-type biogenesis protein CcsB
MDYTIFFATLLYILSTAGYLAFLFLQKNYLHRSGQVILIAGFLIHTGSICLDIVHFHHIPAHNLHGTLLIAGWVVVPVFLALQYRFHMKILGVCAAPLAAATMIAVLLLPQEPSQVKNIFNSAWLILHILAIFTGEAAFALACGIGFLYLAQERAIKTKTPGFFFRRLPSLNLLDATGYACIVMGFTLLSVGLISGFIYAELIWGKFWSWDPKEVWSAITWCIYAALLHQRLTMGWRGRKSAIMAIVGFLAVLFTFFGVNFLLEGHHGVFTRL